MRVNSACVAIALALFVISCRPEFGVTVSQTPGRPPVMRFERGQGLQGLLQSEIRIRAFSISRFVDEGRRRELVWFIKSKSEKAEPLREVTYGVVPDGFEEEWPAIPLVPGDSYDVLGSGDSGIGGTVFKKE